MAQIFVSYSRSDRPFLDQFVPLIRKVYGNDCLWFDDDIHGGEDWWATILHEVGQCSLFIYLISNESLVSPYCQAELREALRLHKRILPVIVRRLNPPYPGVVPDDFAAILRRTQFVDLSGGFRDATIIASLYAAINRLFQLSISPAPPPQTPQPTPQPSVPDKKKSVRVRPFIIIAALIVIAGVAALFSALQNNPGSSTPTPTLTPREAALERANNFSGNNTDWETFETTFEDGIEMVLVPRGCFQMGSAEGDTDETPVHEICFDAPFWIGRTEVTQADFIRLNGVKVNPNSFLGDNRPIETITWFEARDFCLFRGMRLPTEAEWEFAARGPDNLSYPWGDEWDPSNVMWNRISAQGTADVGRIPAGVSWVGALDMAGNMWEWGSSLYRPYPYTPSDGRENDIGNRTDILLVLRGGSWFSSNSNFFRTANRFGNFPDASANDIGFRCARSVE